MIKKILLQFRKLIIGVILFSATPLFAANDFGAGIILGDPTGFSFKYNLSSRNSIDAALAWSNSVDIHLHADYLWNKQRLFHIDHYPVDLFYGVGARIRDRDNHKYHDDDDSDMQLSLRAPIGLRFMFNDPRIEIFTELALAFSFIPSTGVDFDFGIGARYFF